MQGLWDMEIIIRTRPDGLLKKGTTVKMPSRELQSILHAPCYGEKGGEKQQILETSFISILKLHSRHDFHISFYINFQ